MHMSHKKRASTAFKSIGAAGLAAATIVSGLSFGAPAASASPEIGSTTVTGKLVLAENDIFYSVLSSNHNSTGASMRGYRTLAEAKSKAVMVDFPAPGERGRIQLAGGGQCLIDPGSGFYARWGACSNALSFTMQERIGLRTWLNSSHQAYLGLGSSALATYNEIVASMKKSLVAKVDKVNNVAKNAVVSGTATPGAKVSIGSQEVEADKTSGAWSITVPNLTVGANELTVIQKVDGTEHDRKTVTATIVEGGTLVGVDQGPIDLERGVSTKVPFVVENRELRSGTKGSVTLDAPEGTTFDGQTTVQGSWRVVGGTNWSSSTSIPLTDGRLSNDDKTITFEVDWSSDRPVNQQYRFMMDVTADDAAPAGSGAMEFTMPGTSSKGDFKAEGKTTTTLVENVASPTGTVTFDMEDMTEKATVSGTGVNGATITLYAGDSTTAIGTAVVRDGAWSTTIDPIGAGDQKIRIEQSGIDGIQTAETTAQYGAAVALDAPESSTVTPGAVTVTGTGQADTTVTITGGAKPVTTKVEANGTFTADVELAPSNTAKTLTAQQHSKGNLTTSDTITVTPNGAQTAREVVITEPTSHTYQPNRATTVRGTATPYAKVELRFQWNDTVYGTAMADINGNWSITRGFGPAAKYELTATQTRFDTTTSTSAMFTLDPEGITNQEVVITGPADHAYTPGEPTRVTGTATPFATIQLRFQWNDTVYGTAVANAEGNWNIVRAYGPAATYELTATQLRADGTTSLSNTFTLEATGIDRPFTLITPTMDSTFEAGVPVSFTGTGTRGAKITAIAPAWNDNEIFTTEVDDNGTWQIRRAFAPGITYDLTLVQQPTEGDPTSITGVHLTPAS